MNQRDRIKQITNAINPHGISFYSSVVEPHYVYTAIMYWEIGRTYSRDTSGFYLVESF